MRLDVYTDGACSGNPGPGGYAFCVVFEDGIYRVKSGYRKRSTNNHMELLAIIRALEHVIECFGDAEEEVDLKIYSDSAYCVNTIVQKWYVYWLANGWRTSVKNTPVCNKELWERFVDIKHDNPNIKIKVIKVKGHSGNIFNEMVDKAAVEAIRKRDKNKTAKRVE